MNTRNKTIRTRIKSQAWIAIAAIAGLSVALFIYNLYKPKKAVPPHSVSNSSIRAIDTTSIINDQAWFERAYDEGFRLYILHTTNWGTCEEWYRTVPQIRMAIDAGLKVAAYTRDPRCWRQGILATQPYVDQLQFFALDIETVPGVPATRDMVEGIKNLGVRPVIYTGSGMWDDVQKNHDRNFSDVALWDTNVSTFDYSSWTADYLQPTPITYGGWNTSSTMRVGVQQQFEYTLNGIQVDLNSFESSFLK